MAFPVEKRLTMPTTETLIDKVDQLIARSHQQTAGLIDRIDTLERSARADRSAAKQEVADMRGELVRLTRVVDSLEQQQRSAQPLPLTNANDIPALAYASVIRHLRYLTTR